MSGREHVVPFQLVGELCRILGQFPVGVPGYARLPQFSGGEAYPPGTAESGGSAVGDTWAALAKTYCLCQAVSLPVNHFVSGLAHKIHAG